MAASQERGDWCWPAGERTKITVVAPDLRALVPEDQQHRVFLAQTAGFARPGMHLWMPVALTGREPFNPPGVFPSGHSRSPSGLGELITAEPDSVPQDKDRQKGVPIPDMASVSIRLKGSVMSGLIDQEQVPLAPASCYRRYTLPKFLASPCLIYKGKLFSRKTVVASFVNQLGPAHIDWDGKSPEYEMLTNNEWLTITDRNPVLYEVLSIGQILSRSVSAVQFMARVAELDLGPLR